MVELQKIDCNCNDCIHMVRDLDKFYKSEQFHREMCLNEFNRNKKVLDDAADFWYGRGEFEKGFPLEIQANKMKFQFDKKKECLLNFGHCNKFNKDITFIPGNCQIDTQTCFSHRKDQ